MHTSVVEDRFLLVNAEFGGRGEPQADVRGVLAVDLGRAARPRARHHRAARHAEALPLLTEWTDAEHAVLADLGYEGKRTALTTPIKKITDAPLTSAP